MATASVDYGRPQPGLTPAVTTATTVASNNAMDEQLPSPLFALPYEIRDRIYEFYVAFHDSDFNDTLQPSLAYLEVEKLHSTPLPSFMLTSKRAYKELGPHVHEVAVLRVHHRGFYSGRRVGFAVHGVLKLERLRKLVLVVDMEHANWNSWLGFFASVGERARGVERLVVDWRPRPPSERESVGWTARVNGKKEGEFLGAIAGLGRLDTVVVHGTLAQGWKERIMGETAGARTVFFPFRWWREEGLE
ncbi:hypothetical protein MKZ38_009076 [Zalerion maritima]|uniref:Uncharacterized protein n=1 Tax=Zalerion maritima TaxID=339359 RepID=A0AAD5RH18_9PEZI|nr:hypothetical protein MKZ38_009076 [Zalerion maritima]